VAVITTYAGQLSAKLQEYRELGQKDGRKNRPPQNAANPDQHEVALKADAEGYLNREQQLFDAALTEASREATQARQKVAQHQLTVDQLVSDTGTLAAVEAELSSDRASLVRALEARLRSQAELNYFRAVNSIHEEAHYPESRIWHLGLIAILAVIEMVANAFFFENSQGLVGGLFVAFGIAAVNMLIALLAGLGFRYQNLAGSEKKAFGWAVVVLFALATMFCNALFASFRSEYQLVLDPTEPLQVREAFMRAWPQAVGLFRAEMVLKDQQSFILFVFGIILSIVAFWKGYTMDDKHPDYGRKDRKQKQLLAEESRLQEAARQKVKEILHTRKAAVHAALQEPNNQVGMLARRTADLQHARTQLQAQAAAIGREYAMVVDAYRHANVGIRTIPAPAYFEAKPQLSFRTDASHAEAVVTELTSVQEEVRKIAGESKDALNERIQALQSDTSEVLKKTMAVFLAEIQKEAQENVSASTEVIRRVQAA